MASYSGFASGQPGEAIFDWQSGVPFFAAGNWNFIPLPTHRVGASEAWLQSSDVTLGDATPGPRGVIHDMHAGFGSNSVLRNFFYDKIYLHPSIIDIGAVASETDESYVMWNAFFDVVALTDDAIIGDAEGVSHALPVTLPYDVRPLEAIQFDFVFLADGPAVIDILSALTIDGVIYSVAFKGNRMIVFPFPQIGTVSESLESLTAKGEGWATAQRICLRDIPRQSLSVECLLQASDNIKFTALALGWGDKLFGVPLRFESEAVGVLAAGALVINVDTRYAQYFVGSHIFVADNTQIYESCRVDEVHDDYVVLHSALVNDYVAAVVAPLRACYMNVQGVKDERITATLNRKSIDFLVTDNGAIEFDSYVQYEGFDVLEDIPRINSPLSASIVHPVKIRDNQTGKIGNMVTRGVVEVGDQMRWKPNTKVDKWALRQWLHSRKGAQKPFWYPLYRKDFQLLADVTLSESNMSVAFCEGRFLVNQHIMIKLVNGTRIYRKIIASTLNIDGSEMLELSDAFGVSIAIEDIDRISLMILVTQGDNVTIKHYPTHDEAAVTVTTL